MNLIFVYVKFLIDKTIIFELFLNLIFTNINFNKNSNMSGLNFLLLALSLEINEITHNSFSLG
ncbi:hypothetical protein (nucleomorph) [Guillardia theta]|uniref:Uncharacterized protein n=1 Tax=Guillardia theta TaxID=55529 RepID=Q98S37_GUITH|nr:hypothetical protein GTHECHR3102 [Guillardia theta]AAK39746.1 hypothetical protein [Guillardia theta]